MRLLEPLTLGRRTAKNRIMFGPHVTNLGTDERTFSDRHRAYYERRARGGCGIIVTEGASVHSSDWPYERSPLAEGCESGWSMISEACHAHGSLVIASLDHAGVQGSSAYSQAPLWAPSRVPEVNTREVPKWMEHRDIEAVIDGFADAARRAVDAGCDGVEINIGQHSLVRQFMSGLTNHRDDVWGSDRLLFARRIIAAVTSAAHSSNSEAIVVLRLSCDELAPWAGITPQMAPDVAADLCTNDSGQVDYVVVVRGSIFSVEKTRPDFHESPGFNIDTCRSIRERLDSSVAVFLQGSVVDPDRAEWAVDPAGESVCDAVEMTRAQIADPDLANKLASDTSRIRPCILCNQVCQVRDARNPIVSCVVEPTSGHENRDPNWYDATSKPRRVLVIGAGPAGMEAARVAAERGHTVHVIDRATATGGLAAVSGPATPFVEWQRRELEHMSVTVELGVDANTILTEQTGTFDVIVQATGSVPAVPDIDVDTGVTIFDIADIHRRVVDLPAEGTVVILDPIGGPIGVAYAESLGRRAVLVTPDNIAGNELSRTGDLAPANVRLAQLGVTVLRRSIPRSVSKSKDSSLVVRVQDRFSGQFEEVECVAVVDAGFRLPTEPIIAKVPVIAAGDCVAPRTVLEAVLDGRRAAVQI
ncbi:MAG: mycofactocin system FadH/OYE family oxidoreductase 1 [Actinomycetota bacterium]